MDQYLSTGRLPPLVHAAGDPDTAAYVETEVRTRYPWEILQVFSVVGTLWFLYRVAMRYMSRW